MADHADKNFTHEDENWRQRVHAEYVAAGHFKDNWGFLTEGRADVKNVKFDTRLVKYFNPSGGTWTVRAKKVPERVEGCESSSLDKSIPRNAKSAIGAAELTHGARMRAIDNMNPAFIASSSRYGNRTSLEQFGIADYGLKNLTAI
mmetsp:Transcript_35339/g.59565  ORF Transcript_35339/g.59565 Transcript_35339/m.59565 type:complete len:146 (-) Transcript_35339:113-550(-)|eukprot:CAMPEP_0198232198 /NCGR_PEP_ID=MMETSP1445-20131203/115602_1 /TAXON_ID=36898 /ORGANISM="Pyramimonas sp., Strain CCMP2087" /LENGTH=145 /DNA_ID=CAMNT_0043912853 /DNA_START=477 /DNA_END=914 /DNA_ORIENTATION=-